MKKLFFLFFSITVMLLTGCAQTEKAISESGVVLTPTVTLTARPTSTPLPTYTPFPTAVLRPTKTPYPTVAPLILPTHEATSTSAPTSIPAPVGQGSASPTSTTSVQIAVGEAPDLAPILFVADTGATCRGSAQATEALLQLGVTNRGNAPVRERYTIEWSLGWDDYKGLIRTTEVDYHEWGLQWTVWLENKYFWVPCDQTTTFTAYIRADSENTITELAEDNNYAEQSYTITFVP